MQEPNYLLKGVVRARDELEDFSGPLDLILQLLAKNKIEIRDIQISLLLDQYLEYLRMMQEMDLEIASEFVQMASHLTYIKTKMLLTEDKEPTELEVLVSALEKLKNRDALEAIRGVIPLLTEMSGSGYRLHVRDPLPLPDRPYDVPHDPMALFLAMGGLLLSEEIPDQAPDTQLLRAAPKAIVYSVREKSGQILTLLRERGSVLMRELLGMCDSRSELVAAFLSILELCSGGEIRVSGPEGQYKVEYEGTGELREADEIWN